MDLLTNDIEQNEKTLKDLLGNNPTIIVKKILIGDCDTIKATVIYVKGMVNIDIVNRDLLKTLMIERDEKLKGHDNIIDYICERYLMVEAYSDNIISNVVQELMRGMTVVLIENESYCIIVDTQGGMYRQISEPQNESVIKGVREGFNEQLDTNISLIRRKIKDKNLVIEKLIVGRRSQKDIALIYLKDVADDKIVNKIRERINMIDVDVIVGMGELEQYIEYHSYTIFPQVYSTERVDVVEANLSEAKIAIVLDGSSNVVIAPCTMFDFFQSVEEFNQRTMVASLGRILRLIAMFIVVTLPSIYLTLLKFNPELIPIKFITPIIKFRIGIALTPFLEIVAMELVVEFLREGALRLPAKIGSTISIIGGIIIGDAAIKSQIVSPTTVFIIGVTTISGFLIPNYDMGIAIRILRFPMLIFAEFLGIFGIVAGWFFIISHLSALDSFGVPYFVFEESDFKDIFIRKPLWKMNKRPEIIPNKNATRQTDFRKAFRDEKSGENNS